MFGTPGSKRSANYGSDSPSSWTPDGTSASDRKKKRKSRWAQDNDTDKTIIPGMPTVIPNGLSDDQEKQYLLHLQIEEVSRRLRTGDLGIPPNPEERSPSPEPIYNNEGKRLNTREYRTRKNLEEERHQLVQQAISLNCDYKPPADYKPPIVRVNDKVMIPQDEHPEINFVGLLIGPRGNTLKNLEKDTGAKIIIRGKGSVKEGKIGRKDGQPLPGEDEPLHAYVTANNPENVKKAVEKIKEIIQQGIEVPEGQNDLRRQQLRELALLNGTLRENDGLAKLKQLQQAQTIITNTIICSLCGGTGHIAQDCKSKKPGDSFKNFSQNGNPVSQADKAKMDSEYMSLMAELGEGPPPPKTQTQPTPAVQTYRPSFSQPPPNPMAVNPPWQQPARPPPPQVVSNISLSSPVQTSQVQSTAQPPVSYNIQGVQPPMGISTSIQQPVGMQQPGHMHMPAPVAPPSHYSSAGGPVPPPWQSNTMTSQNSAVSSAGGGVPPPSLLSAPPPPPPSSQPPSSWMQQAQGVPPPPPITSASPWQAAPPPPNNMPPWQQPPPMPSGVAPPPPPPPGQQGYSPMAVPPPPPPGAFDMNTLGMLGAPPPPPPT